MEDEVAFVIQPAHKSYYSCTVLVGNIEESIKYREGNVE